MTGIAEAPDAGQKLRLVLDYLPCEACLAQPVKDQELLCSVCRRLHRQVAVRVATRTTVILERPSLPPAAAPVVIPPAAPEPAPEPAAAPEPELEIVTEPYVEAPAAIPEPEPTPVLAQLQEEPPEAEPAKKRGLFRRREEPAPEPEERVFDDVAGFEPTEDTFGVARGEPSVAPEDVFEVAREEPAAALAPPPEPEPVVLAESEPETESDFVFRPPEELPAPRAEEPLEEPEPVEEIPLEPESPAPSPWAPPQEEILADEPTPEPAAAPEPQPARDAVPAPANEEEILETTVVEEEVFAAEVLEEESIPAPLAADAPPSDLLRLRGFSRANEDALRGAGIDSLASLAGHDPNELAARAGVPADSLAPWIQVADLVHELGIPIDSASALVAAGVAGPRGLRELSEEEILDRVEAFGGVRLSGRDVKRWKRRA